MDFLVRFFGIFLVSIQVVVLMIVVKSELYEYNYKPFKQIKKRERDAKVVEKKKRRKVMWTADDRIDNANIPLNYYVPDIEFDMTKHHIRYWQNKEKAYLKRHRKEQRVQLDDHIAVHAGHREKIERQIKKVSADSEQMTKEKRTKKLELELQRALDAKIKEEKEEASFDHHQKSGKKLRASKTEEATIGSVNRRDKRMTSEQTSQGPMTTEQGSKGGSKTREEPKGARRGKQTKLGMPSTEQMSQGPNGNMNNTEQCSKEGSKTREEPKTRRRTKVLGPKVTGTMPSEQTSQGPPMNTEQASKGLKTMIEPASRGLLKMAQKPKLTENMTTEPPSQGPMNTEQGSKGLKGMYTEPVSKGKKTMDEPSTPGGAKKPEGVAKQKAAGTETRKRAAATKKKEDAPLLGEAKTQTLSLNDFNQVEPKTVLEPKTMLEAKTKKVKTISPQKTQGTIEDSPTKKSLSVVRYRQPGQDFHQKALKEQEHELTDGFVEEVAKKRQSDKKRRKEEAERKRLEEEQKNKKEEKTKTKKKKQKK
ncbi:hypothetical protein CAEBREN_24353 [Caenorhabditis brenneri]|uniref:Uncharacterized protein n=1 Tax=Caenorhabditis brenneri TaxID=135651 RepID=G0MJ20_CAEBE|nr:hypothetical protein CAEBREN_24353 [Caenorhabditis brenneri]